MEWSHVLFVDYCDILISYLNSLFDGTHSLHMIHWWANDAMLHFSKSFLKNKNKHLMYILDGRVHLKQIFYFNIL